MVPDPNKPDDLRASGGQNGPRNRDAPGEQNAARGQQGSKRFSYPSWPDERDHDVCSHALVKAPELTPISGRTGLAIAKWAVVDSRDQCILICNRLHAGECEWPWDVQAS